MLYYGSPSGDQTSGKSCGCALLSWRIPTDSLNAVFFKFHNVLLDSKSVLPALSTIPLTVLQMPCTVYSMHKCAPKSMTESPRSSSTKLHSGFSGEVARLYGNGFTVQQNSNTSSNWSGSAFCKLLSLQILDLSTTTSSPESNRTAGGRCRFCSSWTSQTTPSQARSLKPHRPTTVLYSRSISPAMTSLENSQWSSGDAST
jgi:hypothetical protein